MGEFEASIPTLGMENIKVDCQKESQYMIMEVKQKMKDESERFLPEYGLTGLYCACLAQEPAKVLIVRVMWQAIPWGRPG